MKRWIFLLILISFWGCELTNPRLATNENDLEKFEINVPSDFTWSAVVHDVLLVNILTDSVKTNSLDGTRIDLYNKDDELLDALIIRNGIACFDIHVPAEIDSLKLKLPAIQSELVFCSQKRSLSYEVPEFPRSRINKIDSDRDGLFDQFDTAPFDQNIAIRTNSENTNNYPWNYYYIFEDLWPSKGDYDFNDIVVTTNFSQVRGQDNFIKEITCTCVVKTEDPEFGVGFELFESRGSYLIYPGEIIESISGAEKEESIPNGFVVSVDTKKSGTATCRFTIKIKDGSISDFVCVPFIFRKRTKQHQIRPFGTPPTPLQAMELFRSGDDFSPDTWRWEQGDKFKYPLVAENAFYRTRESFPWAVQFMAKNFVAPAENQSLIASYPEFRSWAETGGVLAKDWYNHPRGY